MQYALCVVRAGITQFEFSNSTKNSKNYKVYALSGDADWC